MLRRPFRFSPPAAGALIGLIVGIADWIILHADPEETTPIALDTASATAIAGPLRMLALHAAASR